jgi:folate-binding protein YgfZ
MTLIPYPIAQPSGTAYAALALGAAWFDRSDRPRTIIEGPQAAQMLTGLVTNDVLALRPGQGQYAAAPTPKGKILADLRIFCVGDGRLLVDTAPAAGEGWFAMIRKFLPPRLARHRDVTAETACLGVYGTRASEVVAAATGLPLDELDTLGPYEHRTLPECGGLCFVARSPDIGVTGFDLFLTTADAVRVTAALQAAGAIAGDAATWTVARIEAGHPEWGRDMDDGTIPQEANFDDLRAISYTKGCYTGQETIARVHFRGHVNRLLRGLRFDASSGVPAGARLAQGDKDVGDVRSVGVSPRLGGVGLAMVRREVTPGEAIQARWDGGESPVQVVALPFGD